MKTILVPLNTGFAARYLLQTDILPQLREKNFRVVLLCAEPGEYLLDLQRKGQVELAPYHVRACHAFRHGHALESKLHFCRSMVLNGRFPIHTLFEKYDMFLKENAARFRGPKGYVKKLFQVSVIGLLRRSRLLRRGLLWVEGKFFAPAIHADLFEKYRPDALLTTSLGVFDFDEYLMREARNRGVPVITTMLSWDNSTCKGMPGAQVDLVVAWTEEMERELIDLNDLAPEKVKVAAPAHFDHYFRPETFLSREELFTRLGLDPQRPLVFLALGTPNRHVANAEYLEILAAASQDGSLPEGTQLVVRIHPIFYRRQAGKFVFGEQLEYLREVAARFPGVVLNEPAQLEEGMNYFMPEEEIRFLASLLKYSDVVVNSFSTINLEACVLDRPTINICFEPEVTRFPRKARHDIFHDRHQDHMRRVVDSGAVRVAYSVEELVRQVRNYLADPSLDSSARANLRRQEGGPYLGRAGRQIVSYVEEYLEGGRARPGNI